ncbi:MAG: hypothetical protein MR412_03395 [Firmicutes bacterium]|nr:hypothetical protein [Bacillota bacterium]
MEISCTLTKEAYTNYYYFLQKKTIKLFRILGIIFLVGIALITVAIFTQNTSKQEIVEDLEIQIGLAIVFGLLGLYMIFGYKPLTIKLAQKLYESSVYMSCEPIVTFQFNENNYKVLTTSKYGIEDCTYSYELIQRVIETDTSLYIMIATNQAQILTKNEDTDLINKITTHLRSKLGTKYALQLSKK